VIKDLTARKAGFNGMNRGDEVQPMASTLRSPNDGVEATKNKLFGQANARASNFLVKKLFRQQTVRANQAAQSRIIVDRISLAGPLLRRESSEHQFLRRGPWIIGIEWFERAETNIA
jgi:hypothetical protein